MIEFLLPLLFALCFGGLAFALLRAIREGLASYTGGYAEDTARRYEDIFLFIPAQRILHMARTAAAGLFVLFFLLFGEFTSAAGWVRGLVFATAAALAALFAPGVLLPVLRTRRTRRFNEQLVDSLVSMSSALKAGFSIIQAFESVEPPISQEFGLFLQELRVGVKFEEALRHMEARVGSEDLILMNQAIEIARQTGGNLTEVFEKIAATIRERMRIEQRVRSLTAQGRLQGIVVGSVPVLLLLAMTMIDPNMMMTFFHSRAGLGLLALAAMLEIGGALLIRKVMRIEV